MAFTGIAFRATSGYVTDGAGNTYSLGEAYPTTRGGVTFGFGSSITGDTRDRSTGVDVRLAGIAFTANSGGATSFKVDLPSAGSYKIRLALGDAAGAQTNYCVLKDGATTLATLGPTATIASEFIDAMGTTRIDSNWPGSNVARDVTMAGTQLELLLGGAGGGSGNTAICYIAYELQGAAPTLTSPAGAATGNTTASGTVTTTGNDGTLYAVRSTAQPTNTQIVAGQDSTGAASSAGSLAISSTGAKTVPLIGVAVPTGSNTVWFLHRPAAGAGSDSNVISAAWTQPTAPVLSSPTNTPGSTTALIGATTTVSSGTAYFLARVGGSAASSATIISTGQTSTVTTTSPSRTVTGLTASTANNFVDIVQVSGVTTSNVVSTAAFTTTASGDATVPVLTGSIVIGSVTSSSIQFSWSAGSDNVGVTSYEVSSNGGSGYVDAGLVLTYTFTGLTASTSYALRVRAKDAAGNVSTPALAATQSTAAASGVGSISLNNSALYVFKRNNGAAIASSAVTFWVSDVSTGALIGSAITGLSTNVSGVVTTAVSNASMLAGTTYRLNYEFSSGEYGCVKLPAV